MICKLWLLANDPPKVPDTGTKSGEATWRRLHRIPHSKIENADRRVKETLVGPDHRPAILAWLVRGVLEWRERGLDPPEAIRASTRAWEQDSHPLAGIFDENNDGPLSRAPTGWMASAEIWKVVKEWDRDGMLRSQKDLAERLKSLGLKPKPGGERGKTRGWVGLRRRDAGVQQTWEEPPVPEEEDEK